MKDLEKPTESGERILVCVSASPSNPKVIDAAAKLAKAFRAPLTAIYVKPFDDDSLPAADRLRLQNNIHIAEQAGASVITIVGSDVPVQIAEYARISGITKIVVGRSGARRLHIWSRPPVTEQVIINAPDVDVYIIPDSSVDLKDQRQKLRPGSWLKLTWRDTFTAILLLAVFTCVGFAFSRFGFSEANIITVFILGILVIAVATVNPVCSAAASLASVLLFNYFFIEPKFSFHTYETEYAVTFVIMLIASLITGSLANRLKENARQYSRKAFRTKVLFDTNQLLQKAEQVDDVIRITGQQVITLLDRDVVIFPAAGQEKPEESIRLNAVHAGTADAIPDQDEAEIAAWVFRHQTAAGANTDHFRTAGALYHPICMNGYCYGVIGIYLNGDRLEAFEYSVLASILGECALTLENLRNAAEKEQAAIAVRNEQLRSNLLRSISHDIRTPLTSISGNASNLASHYEQLDRETLEQIFSDIYDDAEWLIELVENLLYVSRFENGQIDLNLTLDLVNDVIDEALRHVDRNVIRHHIVVSQSDDLLMAKMDARLIMQVLINLINNAIKNTQDGSEIRIRSEKKDDYIYVSVTDDGPGIPDDIKPHIFEMFYTGPGRVTDGRRSIGLGLALCRSIVEAHGGSILLTDNCPTGCCFTFSLPAEEVMRGE